jgi:redox-sensing transcriptional repressor
LREIPVKTIERLSLYRRILKEELAKNNEFIYSHDLADLTNKNSAQIRRDLMYLDKLTSTQKGYYTTEIIEKIDKLLDSSDMQKMAIIGVGNMGKALINFFKGRGKNLSITACFEIDPDKIGRIISGCRCYSIDDLEKIIKQKKITIGIIAVPELKAQKTADLLIKAEIKAIVNIAPVPIKVPESVYVENVDLTSSFEKTAYFAKIIK